LGEDAGDTGAGDFEVDLRGKKGVSCPFLLLCPCDVRAEKVEVGQRTFPSVISLNVSINFNLSSPSNCPTNSIAASTIFCTA
jgi:hypothetical protein